MCIFSLPLTLTWFYKLNCGKLCWQKLEKLLPPRPKIEIPTGEDVEEVDLVEFDESRSQGARREAYDDDEDDDHPGHGPRVQCAHQ